MLLRPVSFAKVLLVLFTVLYSTASAQEKSQDLPSTQELHDDRTPRSLESAQESKDSNDQSDAPTGYRDRSGTVAVFVRALLNEKDAARNFQKQIDELKNKSSDELLKEAENENGIALYLLGKQAMDDRNSEKAEMCFRDALSSFDENEIGLDGIAAYPAYQIHLAILESHPDLYDRMWAEAKKLIEDTNPETDEANRQLATKILKILSPSAQPRYSPAHVWRANQLFLHSKIPREYKLALGEQQLLLALYADPGNNDARILMAERVFIPQKKISAGSRYLTRPVRRLRGLLRENCGTIRFNE